MPVNYDELKYLLQSGYIPIGGGSNILFTGKKNLFSDKYLPKFIDTNDYKIIVSSNTNINYLISYLSERDIGGLEFLVGIPAHLGGLVKMNAGAFGENILEYVDCVYIIDSVGKHKKITEFEFSYRKTDIDGFIYKIVLNLKKSKKSTIKKRVKNYLQKRILTQPLSRPNLGCIFKNPQDLFAGKLIQDCGLKGLQIGDAKVSNLHANFIVNMGKTTSGDILGLINIIKEKVHRKKGIDLETEIVIL